MSALCKPSGIQADNFTNRHIGPRPQDLDEMLKVIGVSSIDELIDQTVPKGIRSEEGLHLPSGISEAEYFQRIRKIASKNKLYKTYIGQGYYDTNTPAVITRNILENPSWYTSYTPYQAEISQGRLEALLNFQTMVLELTKMEIANASLLDESTAAAEAMLMLFNSRSRDQVKSNVNSFFVDKNIFAQNLAVIQTRAYSRGIDLIVDDYSQFNFDTPVFGAIVQYPNSTGEIIDYSSFTNTAHKNGCPVAVIADLLSLAILTPPGEWGADVVLGSTQRFGIPMGYGGPHAAYFATTEKFKRIIPGRIIGVSKDWNGNIALRMALQTREQHIKRERATSNICTAQALLATMAGMYGVYHGPDGIRRIANNTHYQAGLLAQELEKLGYNQLNKNYFDTLRIGLPNNIKSCNIQGIALENEINFLYINEKTVGISLDETTTPEDVNKIIEIFVTAIQRKGSVLKEFPQKYYFDEKFRRTSSFMDQPLFHNMRSETELMRYIKKLERRDISLTQSMISLGSCTMKLNAAIEMLPITWPEFAKLHPFIPRLQASGYHEMFSELEKSLTEITGLSGISLQPNSGAAGEYAGLLVIKKYHEHNGQKSRNIVLIPASAHGTNPASAAMSGAQVVVVACDEKGNIDLEDLKKKAEIHRDHLMAFMVTYPSTHGVFESSILEMCEIVHDTGGLVYMDGANMNAQVGLTNPGIIGADVCHLNLHKTFAIPHGGGGPGVGPICVAEYLKDFLPAHPVVATGGKDGVPAVSAAPYGSAGVMVITHAYIKLLGKEGLTESTRYAILNANYLASTLGKYFPILYTGENKRVGHEMILDCRQFKSIGHISESDIAKRLMDYGFHAPTLSFPVHGTLMVEPTESEPKQELDRFIETMINIYNEIQEVKEGIADEKNNVLKNAPHTQFECTSDDWDHSYSRAKAAFPLEWIRANKFWPVTARIDDAFGDRNLVCSCDPIEDYM